MNLINRLKSSGSAIAFICIAGFSSCKKESAPATDDPTDSQRAALTRDSIYLYAKEVYLWNDVLPTIDVFNPDQYTGAGKDLDNYNAELFAITRYKKDPATGQPYEYRIEDPGVPKFSYIQDLQDKNPAAVMATKADVNSEGVGYDLGIFSFVAYEGLTNEYDLFIKAVYPGSSADKEGLTRGMQITAIDGKSIGNNFNNEVDAINELLGNTVTSAKLSGIDKNGKAFTKTITRTSYTSSPVYKDKVFTVNGKKVGYMFYGRFSQLTSGDSSSPSDANLDPVFARFATEGITDLIIDLRYNGGGLVNSAEYLVNLIAPSTAKGTMYYEVYNSLMQNNQANILTHQPLTDAAGKIRYSSNGKMLTYADVDFSTKENTAVFNKKGSLNGVKNVVFIVSGNTASASELAINCLKPFVNVKLIGQTTYGKPVGFFPVTLENRYDVYFSMFETKNSKDEGGYYAGFTPDVVDEFDDAKHDFDDEDENYISRALSMLAPARVSAAKAQMSIQNKSLGTSTTSKKMINKIVQPKTFVGMIETRHAIK
jgi:C-terminal processing protease CtpA/Prc